MDFAEQIRELAALVDIKKGKVATEQATKMALVEPLLKVLGYDISDPDEVIPEYSPEMWDKKEEKVDYLIAIDKDPKIIIEVKMVKNALQRKTANQLLKYYTLTKARFAILTNGIQYQFYSDLEEKHLMDTAPFLIVNIVPSIRDQEIAELKRFHKSNFNAEEIISIAKELKYVGEIKRYLKQQIKTPDESFVRLIIKNTSYPGIVTKSLVERFSSLFHNAFKQYLNETIADTLKDTIEKTEKPGMIDSPDDRDYMRHRFWTQLLTYSKNITPLHSKITPGQDSWCGMGAGTSGLGYNYVIFQHKTRVELYIDKGNREANKEIFDKLVATKSEIETNFGGPLEWERLDEKRACRIKKDLPQGGYRDDEKTWPKVHEAMVDAMIRLHKALSPHIQYLRK
jgi:predicted type IV restriction endonuclease